MSVKHEILTVQIGPFSNLIGSHFWNFKEDYLAKVTDYENSPLNLDVFYRTGTAFGHSTYTPRLISLDLQGGMGSVRPSGYVYDTSPDYLDAPEESLSDAAETYDPDSVIREPSRPRNRFLNTIMKGEDLSPDDTPENLLATEEEEPNFDDICWTDYLLPHIHPKTPVLFPTSSLQPVANDPFNSYEIGEDCFKDSSYAMYDECEDAIHRFFEESDHPGGVFALVDADSVWGGVGSRFLIDMISDDNPKLPIYLFPSMSHVKKLEEDIQENDEEDKDEPKPSTETATPAAPQQSKYQQFANAFAAQYIWGRTMSELVDVSAQIIPFSSHFWSPSYCSSLLSCIPTFDLSKRYFQSAFFGAQLEMFSRPFNTNTITSNTLEPYALLNHLVPRPAMKYTGIASSIHLRPLSPLSSSPSVLASYFPPPTQLALSHPLNKHTVTSWPPFPGRGTWSGDSLKIAPGSNYFMKGQSLTLDDEKELRQQPTFSESLFVLSDVEAEHEKTSLRPISLIHSSPAQLDTIVRKAFNTGRSEASDKFPSLTAVEEHVFASLGQTPIMNGRTITAYPQDLNIPVTFPPVVRGVGESPQTRLFQTKTLQRLHCSPSLAIPLTVLADVLMSHKYHGFITGLSRTTAYSDTIEYLKTASEAYRD
ncbi:putative Misato like protein [Blattamonas nauphoetae]|uniref:Misato like protein n=1 Tax=Blattamonas nauphoetae TaxID=2049346 RepID=A0ABQ9XNZ4_9EUKA|nr:putative Misato like protein [Blattamonas nauphoetae]